MDASPSFYIMFKNQKYGYRGTNYTLRGILLHKLIYLFIYLGFYVAFNTVQVISRRVVGRAEETST